MIQGNPTIQKAYALYEYEEDEIIYQILWNNKTNSTDISYVELRAIYNTISNQSLEFTLFQSNDISDSGDFSYYFDRGYGYIVTPNNINISYPLILRIYTKDTNGNLILNHEVTTSIINQTINPIPTPSQPQNVVINYDISSQTPINITWNNDPANQNLLCYTIVIYSNSIEKLFILDTIYNNFSLTQQQIDTSFLSLLPTLQTPVIISKIEFSVTSISGISSPDIIYINPSIPPQIPTISTIFPFSRPFKAVVWGDTKGGPGTLSQEAQVIINDNLNPNLLLYSGDVCASGPSNSCFSTWKTACNGGNKTGQVLVINVVNQGTGYTSTPTVSITGGSGSSATASATISGGKVTFISVTNMGSGYTTTPIVSITDGGGSGATGTAIIGGLFDKSFAVRGNHDDGTTSNWESKFDFVTVKDTIGATNYQAKYTDRAYCFDYGNSIFIGLDMIGQGFGLSWDNTQINWVDDRLTDAENRGLKHAFIYFHAPIYPVNGHCCPIPPSNWIDIFNKHPIITATFHGHEHIVTYTHVTGCTSCSGTKKKLPNLKYPIDEIISGGAGASNSGYNIDTSKVDYTLGNQVFGFATIEISGVDYTVKFYKANGTLTHTETLSKTTKFLTVTSPNPNSSTVISWAKGTNQTIKWTSNNIVSTENVKIELYKAGTKITPSIIDSTPNNGTYVWNNIPTSLTNGTDYKIRITLLSDVNNYDESNNNFTISGGSVTCSDPAFDFRLI